MCGFYYPHPHPSNTIFISKEIKDDAEGENAYEEDEDIGKKIQPTYLKISTRSDPCMPKMTSKN